MADKEKTILVVAIDIGTSSSGYAYSFKEDYKRNPLEITLSNQDDTNYPRFPTCVLLNPEMNSFAFGYDAKEKYFYMEQNRNDYYFFGEYQLGLHDSIKLSEDTLIKDIGGKKAPALGIFVHVIQYLKDHLLKFMETRGLPVDNEDIHWVLPVPAIWDKSSTQFMTEAANKAGIPTEQLTVCLEPEAISLYSQHAPATNLMGNPDTKPLLSFKPGTKYMIIDLGGKPADTYCYQTQSDGTIKELYRPKGRIRESSRANEAFDQMMTEIFGECCFKQFKDKYKEDYIEMHWEFEAKTYKMKAENDTSMKITLPSSFFEVFDQESNRDMLRESRYAHKFRLRHYTFVMNADLFQDFFLEPVEMLLEQLRVLMMKNNLSDISLLLVVGAFSESPLIYEAIMNAFPEKMVIVPKDNDLAMLKGAVMFGHTR